MARRRRSGPRRRGPPARRRPRAPRSGPPDARAGGRARACRRCRTGLAPAGTPVCSAPMPASALALALAAAFVHAIWNMLLAGARDSQAATAVALAIGVVLFAPVAALTWDVRSAAVPFVLASSALEVLYFVFLAGAYQSGELGLVYPIARGSA